MTEFPAIRNPNRCPTRPGVVLSEAVAALRRPKTEIADALGISRQHLYDVMAAKKPISPDVAVRLGKLMGNGGGLWLRMQATHDLWKAEREIAVSKIPTLAA